MAETLGEAVLVLRTDDRAYTAGVGNAQGRAEALGRSLDDTAGAAGDLGKSLETSGASALTLAQRMTEAAATGDRGAKAFAAADAAIGALAEAQARATTELTTAKAAFEAGETTAAQYNREVLQTRTALGLVQGEYVKAATELRKTIAANDGATASHERMSASSMMVMHSFRSASDSFAAGLPITMILTEQMSRLAEAASMAGGGEGAEAGALGKLGAFMSTGWGMAITIGVSALVPLITHLMDADSASDKLHKTTLLLVDALQKGAAGTEASRKALADYNAEQDKARKSGEEMIRINLADAKARLDDALAIRHQLQAELDRRNKTVEETRALGEDTGGAEVMASITQGKISDNNFKIAELDQTRRNLEIENAARDAKAAVNPIKAINDLYDDQAAAAKRAAAANDTLARSLKGTLTGIEQKRAADLKAAEDAKRAAGHGDSGEANLGDMVALIERLFPGAHITSTTGGKHVAGSDHYSGHAIDFVPAGGMGQYSKADVEKILKDAGVDIRRNAGGVEQFFGPGDPGHDNHFHVAWQGSPSPEAAAKRAAQAAEKAARDQEAFDNEKERLGKSLLQAQQKGLSDADAIAASQSRQVDLEHDKEAEAIAAAVKSGKYSQAQGRQLDQLNEAVTTAEKAKIERDRQVAQLQRGTDLQVNLIDIQIQGLQKQTDAAKTQDQRRALQLQILDLERQQAELKFNETIELAKVGKATAEQAQAAQAGLTQLHASAAADRKVVIDRTAGPIEDYAKSLEDQRTARGEKVQGLIVSELDWVNQSIDSAITSRLGIKDPLLAGLIDMFIKDVLIRPIAQALQSASSGGGGGAGIFGSIFGSIFGGGGGGLSGIQMGGQFGIDNFSPLGGFAGLFADGGLIPAGGFGIVGERGPEPIFATSGGVGVLPNSALRSFGAGGGNATPGKLEISVSGARGNAEIQQMVQAGVAQGLAAYDAQVGTRVQDNLARRG